MRQTLLEIDNFALWHALILAVVLAGAAAFLVWREQRLGRIEEGEFAKSLLAAVGMACFIVAVFFIITRFVHPVRIRSYGVMLMLAFAAGIGIAMSRAPFYRIEPLNVIDLSLFILFGSIIGARLVYIILNWGAEYATDPRSVLNVWEGGLAFHGGLIGGALGGYLFCRWRRIRPTLIIDMVAPSVAFGYAVARVGCFINGCCSGAPSDLPWAVDFHTDTVLGPVHPTQLYSSIGHILVGLALLKLATRVRVPGQLGLWFLVMSSLVRMFVEVFRRGYTAWPWSVLPALTQAQAASLAIAIVALAIIILTRNRVGYPLADAASGDADTPGAGAAPKPPRKSRKGRRRR